MEKPIKLMTTNDRTNATWTFFTNHFHVLICLALNSASTLKDVAARVGITERAVQRLITELEDEGYLLRERIGRQNQYQLVLDRPLRHILERHCDVNDLVSVILKNGTEKPLEDS